jgi:hypothetical protein
MTGDAKQEPLVVTQADKVGALAGFGYKRWVTWEGAPQHGEGWIMLRAKDFARHRQPEGSR